MLPDLPLQALSSDLSDIKDTLILIDLEIFVYKEVRAKKEKYYMAVHNQKGELSLKFMPVDFIPLKKYLPAIAYSRTVQVWNKTRRANIRKKEKYVEVIKEIIAYLNSKVGTTFKPDTKQYVSVISARLDEGHAPQDFKTIIDKKIITWNNPEKPEMMAYLRPETLFAAKHFETYLNEATINNDRQRGQSKAESIRKSADEAAAELGSD